MGIGDLPSVRKRREQLLDEASKALGPVLACVAADRGAATLEQELVALVARGRTDTQIAEQLHISVRTVRSRLDRIRDKTGCRRRADLTRLALLANLV